MFSFDSVNAGGGLWVKWKGQVVEHYSGGLQIPGPAQTDALAELRPRCEHVEALGMIPTTGSVVWYYSWLEHARLDSPYLDYLRHMPGLWERDGELGLLLKDVKDFNGGWHEVGRMLVWNQGWRTESLTADVPDVLYHVLDRLGWKLADVGQGEHLGTLYGTTEGVVACFERHHLPLEFPAELYEQAQSEIEKELEAWHG